VSLETHKKHVWTNDVPAGIKTNLWLNKSHMHSLLL
jgi:hypothetical protein